MMRLSCFSEQLVRSWEQLVLKDTKKGFYYALCISLNCVCVCVCVCCVHVWVPSGDLDCVSSSSSSSSSLFVKNTQYISSDRELWTGQVRQQHLQLPYIKLVTCIYCRKRNIFLLWPKTLTYALELRNWLDIVMFTSLSAV